MTLDPLTLPSVSPGGIMPLSEATTKVSHKMRDESSHATSSLKHHTPVPCTPQISKAWGPPAIPTNHGRSLAFRGRSKPELTLWCLASVHRSSLD